MNISLKTPYSLREAGLATPLQTTLYPTAEELTANQRLFILCEGIGGIEKGDVASGIIANAFQEYFQKVNPIGTKSVGQLYINEALRYAERRINKHLQHNPATYGMKSTMGLLHFNEDNTVTAAWVGDCRLYHIRKNQILYKTEDHVSSTWQNGKYVLLPKTIAASEPAWASTHVIEEVEPGDYFLLCSQGVLETLTDRNLKYLFSQSDYTDDTNQAIVGKVKDLCKEVGQRNCAMFLVQVDGQPANPLPAKKKTGAGASAIKGPDIGKPKGAKKSKVKKEKGEANKPLWGKSAKERAGLTSKLPLLLALGILLGAAVIFAYNYAMTNPEELFKQHYESGTVFLEEGNYENAIAELEKAIVYEIEDTASMNKANRFLALSKERYALQQGNDFLSNGDLLKAIAKYNEVLDINPNNVEVQQKIFNLQEQIVVEKETLVTEADSLMLIEDFKSAKDLLLEALVLARSDSAILTKIDTCVARLEADSIFIAAMELEAAAAEAEAAAALQEAEETVPEQPEDRFANEMTREERPAIVENNRPNSEPTYNNYRPELRTNPSTSTSTNPSYGISSTTIKRNAPSTTTTTTPTPSTPRTSISPSTVTSTPSTTISRPSATISSSSSSSTSSDNSTKAANLIGQGDASYKKGDYKAALRFYEQAYELDRNRSAENKMRKTKKKLDDDSNYKDIVANADAAFKKGDYHKAKQLYWNALSFESADQYPSQRIEECNAKIETTMELDKYVKAGDQALAAGDFERAISQYESALVHTTDKKSLDKKIRRAKQKLQEKKKAALAAKEAAAAAAAAKAKTEEPVPVKPTSVPVTAKPKKPERPKESLRDIEKFCKSDGFSYPCYVKLKTNDQFAKADKRVLFRLGKHFEQVANDNSKAKECYQQAARNGSDQAKNRLKKLK